jgi:asparagine synthase (glutamine-hydrolysing)
MCGIVAAYNRTGAPVDRAQLIAMREELHHRGPDDEGELIEGPIGLGHRRLSVVDLSPAGRQPLSNEDGTLWLIFNGEIYNYVELATRLRSRGHRFQSHTDSEVILHLYEDEGEACLQQLNGMFAFVLWDRRSGSLFAARDRIGIKPLSYFANSQWFLCASEVKALLAHPAVEARPDWEGIADFLFAGQALGHKTMFRGIRQLPPGHSLTLKDDRLTIKEYWAPVHRYDWNRSAARVSSDLMDLLDDAVRIECRSDAPLGSHLSGGIDSSVVASLAVRHHQPMKTFSIRFAGGPYFDESAHARAVAGHLGTEHHEDTPDSDDLRLLYPKLMWHQGVPIADASGFTYYATSRLAARHVKVVLTGHGGDEIFAGYPAQFDAAFGSTRMFDFSTRPRTPQPSGWARLRRVYRREGLKGVLRRSGNHLAPRVPSDLKSLWVLLHCGPDPTTDRSFDPRFRNALAGYTPREEYLAPLEQAQTDQLLDKVLYHDLRVYLPSLLHKEDRASMSVSLESRVPLLDHRLIEYLATVPPAQKVPGLMPKALLREVGRPLLPSSVVERRDKVPFASPESDWLTTGQLPLVDSVLAEQRTLERGVFAPDEIREPGLGPDMRFTIFNIELWFRLFIDQDPYWLELAKGGPTRSARRIKPTL